MVKLQKKFKRRPLVLSAVVVAVILVVAILLITHRPKPSVATIPSTNPLKVNKSDQSNPQTSPTSDSSTPSAPNKSTNNASAADNNLPLTAPYGTFISNHKPGQNGSPTTEQSTCNTTPGATCYIKLTQGSLTRTLATQTADSNGAVIWNWDIKDTDLSSGSWVVTAVASLNNQSKTTSDPLPLEIQP